MISVPEPIFWLHIGQMPFFIFFISSSEKNKSFFAFKRVGPAPGNLFQLIRVQFRILCLFLDFFAHGFVLLFGILKSI